jgi:hypothetical protein
MAADPAVASLIDRLHEISTISKRGLLGDDGIEARLAPKRDLIRDVSSTARCVHRFEVESGKFLLDVHPYPAGHRLRDAPALLSKDEFECILIARALEWFRMMKDKMRKDIALRRRQRNGRPKETDHYSSSKWLRKLCGYFQPSYGNTRSSEHVLRLSDRPESANDGATDLVASGHIREHTCAAILSLARSVEAVESKQSGGDYVRAVEIDLHGGMIKVVLGDAFDDRGDLTQPPSSETQKFQEIRNKVSEASSQLSRIRSLLAASGLPLRTWLMEQKGSLLDLGPQPKATHEPALSKQYLERVAEAMWTLSIRVFGEGVFSYEVLADYMREPVTERVKRAARRIHNEASKGRDGPLLWLGRDAWRWRRTPPPGAGLTEVLAQAEQAIRRLADPLSDG